MFKTSYSLKCHCITLTRGIGMLSCSERTFNLCLVKSTRCQGQLPFTQDAPVTLRIVNSSSTTFPTYFAFWLVGTGALLPAVLQNILEEARTTLNIVFKQYGALLKELYSFIITFRERSKDRSCKSWVSFKRRKMM